MLVKILGAGPQIAAMIIDPTRPSFRTGLAELIRPLRKKQHRSVDQDEESKGANPQDRRREKHLHRPSLADHSADPDDRGDVDAEKDCDPAVRAWIAALCGMSASMAAKPSKAAPSTSQP
jgi:hypothetical protein